MAFVTTQLSVNPDGTISTSEPLPVGQHVAVVDVEDRPLRTKATEPIDISTWPIIHMERWPWADDEMFRREDIYGDDGR